MINPTILPCGGDHNDADNDEGELLGPHGDVDVDPEPVDQDVKRLSDWVNLRSYKQSDLSLTHVDQSRLSSHLADPVKHDVDGGDEDLPGAVDREEVSEDVEVFPLARGAPLHALQRVLELVRLEEEEPGELLECLHLGPQQRDVVRDGGSHRPDLAPPGPGPLLAWSCENIRNL